MARKPKSADQATGELVKAIQSDKPLPPLTKTAEEQNLVNITSSVLVVDDLVKLVDTLSERVHHRFPECTHCGEYVKTTRGGIRLKYTPKGTKAGKSLVSAIKTIRKAINDMRDGGALYFKAAPKLVEAAKAAGVTVNVPAHGDAPDPGHKAGVGEAAAPKKRGRKGKSAEEKAAAKAAKKAEKAAKKAANAAAAAPAPKTKGKAAPAPAAADKTGMAGKLSKKEKEALAAVNAKPETIAKYSAKDSQSEREVYLKRLHSVAAAQAGKLAKAAEDEKAAKKAEKAAKAKATKAANAAKAAPARGGRSEA